MQDVVLVAVLLSACAAIGYPICLLFPSDRFEARWVVAPPIGFGLFAVGGTVFYLWGVAPRISMMAMAAAGLIIGAACSFRASPRRLGLRLKRVIVLGAGIAAVSLICLLPGWTGGPEFRVFQGNVYDHMTYLGGAVTFRNRDYKSMEAEAASAAGDPVVQRAARHLQKRGAVSIVHAAIAGVVDRDSASASYAYMATMQIMMFFAAALVFLNVFAGSHPLSLFLALSLTVGFFQQYVFDISAWSELSTQPLYLIFIAIVALAFETDRFGTREIAAALRIALIFGSLLGGALFLYPEALTIYGVGAAAAVILALASPAPPRTKFIGVVGLGLGTGVALMLGLLFWSGTVAYLYDQLSHAGVAQVDWWRYFQSYLFGSEKNYLAILLNPSSRTKQVIDAYLSLPVESVTAGLGLHFLLPTASWPNGLAALWKIALSGFLAALLYATARTIMWNWRTNRGSSATRMIAACLGGLPVPVALLFAGLYWSAGKGLSMAAPMLFCLATAPLLSKASLPKIAYAASFAFAFGHLALGALRPIIVAQPGGGNLPGFPNAAAQVRSQKAGLNWNQERLAAELRQCRGVRIDVDNASMDNLLRRIAVDVNIPWAASRQVGLPELSWVPNYLPEGWQQFDCLATAKLVTAKPGQTIISLADHRTILAFFNAQTANIEFGTRSVPGIASYGVYGVELMPSGALQWTSQVARFEIPNNPAKPAKTLRLVLWPMSLTANVLRITVNGETAYDGNIPSSAMTVPLGKFSEQRQFIVELRTNTVTHFPNDPRALGLAIRQLSISK